MFLHIVRKSIGMIIAFKAIAAFAAAANEPAALEGTLMA